MRNTNMEDHIFTKHFKLDHILDNFRCRLLSIHLFFLHFLNAAESLVKMQQVFLRRNIPTGSYGDMLLTWILNFFYFIYIRIPILLFSSLITGSRFLGGVAFRNSTAMQIVFRRISKMLDIGIYLSFVSI